MKAAMAGDVLQMIPQRLSSLNHLLSSHSKRAQFWLIVLCWQSWNHFTPRSKKEARTHIFKIHILVIFHTLRHLSLDWHAFNCLITSSSYIIVLFIVTFTLCHSFERLTEANIHFFITTTLLSVVHLLDHFICSSFMSYLSFLYSKCLFIRLILSCIYWCIYSSVSLSPVFFILSNYSIPAMCNTLRAALITD